MRRSQSRHSATRRISSGMKRRAQGTYVLDRNEICSNQWDVIHLAEHADDPPMVNAGNENSEKIGQQRRLLLEIERESLVISGKII